MVTKLNSKVILDYMAKNELTPIQFCNKCNITKQKFLVLMSRFDNQSINTLISIHIGTNIPILKLIEERS